MAPPSYRRQRFPPEIIQHAIWLYLRFTLSYRDVEELLAERGLDISYETVRRWVLKFGPAIARRLRQRRPRRSVAFGRDGGAHRQRADSGSMRSSSARSSVSGPAVSIRRRIETAARSLARADFVAGSPWPATLRGERGKSLRALKFSVCPVRFSSRTTPSRQLQGAGKLDTREATGVAKLDSRYIVHRHLGEMHIATGDVDAAGQCVQYGYRSIGLGSIGVLFKTPVKGRSAAVPPLSFSPLGAARCPQKGRQRLREWWVSRPRRVFLCVTGAEALYADMGHFGAGEPAVIISRALAHPAFVPLVVDEVD
jgi:K+ potassium transporter integral membrane domain